MINDVNRYEITLRWLEISNSRTEFNENMVFSPPDSLTYKLNKEQDDYAILQINKLLTDHPWLYDVMNVLDVGA